MGLIFIYLLRHGISLKIQAGISLPKMFHIKVALRYPYCCLLNFSTATSLTGPITYFLFQSCRFDLNAMVKPCNNLWLWNDGCMKPRVKIHRVLAGAFLYIFRNIIQQNLLTKHNFPLQSKGRLLPLYRTLRGFVKITMEN